MNKNNYRIHDTTIYYRNNTVKVPKGADSWRFKYPHFGTLHRIFNMLRAEGFTIENDAEVAKCIRDDYYIGRRGDLELYAHRYPAGFEIIFFQNIVIENQNGGRYDFDKFQKMPYMIRLRFIKYRDKIIALLNPLKTWKTTRNRVRGLRKNGSRPDMRKNGTMNKRTQIFFCLIWTARRKKHITDAIGKG